MNKTNNLFKVIQKQICFYSPLIFVTVITMVLIFIRQPLSWFDWYNFGSSLFLAWSPLFFAVFAHIFLRYEKIRIIRYLLYLLWFLFFPNSIYVVSEFVHFVAAYKYGWWKLTFWFDLILFCTYILSGFMAGLFSLCIIHHHIKRKLKPLLSWIVINGYLVLCGLAIFLGRFLRWNSWEFFTQPYELYDHFIGHLKYSGFLSFMSIITFLFYTIIIVTYICFFSYVDKQYFIIRKKGYHEEI